VIATSGKHDKWAKGERRSPVPRHNEIAPGTARAVCDQLGIPRPANVR
jgi:HicA toxin of bacterial toxin-antitoxin,